MKSYNEMAASALQRIEEHEKIRERKRKTIDKIATPAVSFCLVTLLGIGAWQFGTPQDVVSPQKGTQTIIVSTGDEDATVKSNDRIFVNLTEGFSADKINIDLRIEDFVKMSALQLNEYYGTNVFPAVPADLKDWAEADDFGGYGIYRSDNGLGDIYWDQNVLNYSNSDFTRNVNIELAKDRLPILDFGLDAELKESIISDCSVYLGIDKEGNYQARFIYNDTGFVVNADGLSREEFVAVIKSILE